MRIMNTPPTTPTASATATPSATNALTATNILDAVYTQDELNIVAHLKTFGVEFPSGNHVFDAFYALGMATVKAFEEHLPAAASGSVAAMANCLRDARDAACKGRWGQVRSLQRSIVFTTALLTNPAPVIEFPSGNDACDIFYALGVVAVDAFEVFLPPSFEMFLSDLRFNLLDARQSACAAKWDKIRSLQREIVFTTVMITTPHPIV
jgi:hypothetical protein